MTTFKMFWPLWLVLLFGCKNNDASNKRELDSTQVLQREFEHHFKILDSAVKNSISDTIRCCSVSIEFMEQHTKIEAHTEGSYVGPLDFLKSDFMAWKKWYNDNKDSSLLR